jgi:hypothetical protein
MMMEANLSTNTANAGIPPMPFGVMLERVYRILRDHMKVFLGLAVPPAVATIILYGAMMGFMFTNLRPYLAKGSAPLDAAVAQLAMMRVLFPAILVMMIPMMAVFAFYLAAAFYASNKIDSGVGASVRECFGQGWARLGRSLGLFLWIYFRAFGPLLAIEVVGFGISGWLGLDGAGHNLPSAFFAIFPIGMLLFVASYVYGVIVGLRLSLAFPASIEEGLTAGEAIRRSGQLTKGSKGRIFLLLLVIYAIANACVMVLYFVGLLVIVIGALVMAAMSLHPTDPLFVVAAVVAGIAVLCFLYVWIALLYASMVVTLSVVYHDQRRRMDASLPAQLSATGTQLPPGAEPA